MATPPPIHVIFGAGICGLALSRCLLHLGIISIIHEKESAKPRHFHRIIANPSSCKVGVFDGGLVGSRKVEDRNFRVNRESLERLLREGSDVRWEWELEKVALQELRGKGIHFIGESAHAEPVIGGDGANEAVRDAMGPAKCVVGEEEIGLMDGMRECMGSGRRMLGRVRER